MAILLAGGITVCSYVSSLEPGFPIPACCLAAGSQENHSQISPPGTETTPTALLSKPSLFTLLSFASLPTLTISPALLQGLGALCCRRWLEWPKCIPRALVACASHKTGPWRGSSAAGLCWNNCIQQLHLSLSQGELTRLARLPQPSILGHFSVWEKRKGRIW